MKAIYSPALLVCAAALLAACGGTKDTAATVPATHGEFDPATGSWKPLTKVVKPQPHEQGAEIVEEKKPGMMNKVGNTLKKPLHWVGIGKEEPQPAPAAETTATTAKKAPVPQ